MTSLFHKKFARDVKAEADGRWFPHPDIETLKVLVRPENASDVRDYIARQVRGQRKLLIKHKGVLPAAESDRNDIDLCADKLLRGWAGVEDEAGVVVPFSRDMAIHYLTKYPEFRSWVLGLARDPENFGLDAPEILEEMVGNSSTSSSGASSTETTQKQP